MILTNENYFSKEADMEYMSVSQFKAFEQCEAAALASVKGEWERTKTTALLVGSYVDAHLFLKRKIPKYSQSKVHLKPSIKKRRKSLTG